MKLAKKGFFLFIFVMIAATYCFAEAQEDPLVHARRFVEEKSYDEALKVYESISSQLSKDPGLMIEWARVYTYANHHPQAIALFERVRKEYPDKEKEILRELGDQYKWNGQLKKSIEIYRKGLELNLGDLQIELALAQSLAWDGQRKDALNVYNQTLSADPENVQALLGKAEVLSWNDKLAEARKIYEAVLQKEPRNLTAKNGIARICVWQGYHRLGIKRYQKILEEYPDDPDALEGLAFAYHWDGQEAKAFKTAEKLIAAHPDRHAVGDLLGEIKNVKRPHVSQANRFSDDSNNLYIAAEKAHVGTYLGDATTVGATYEWYLYRQRMNTPIKGNRGGVDVSHRFNEYWEANSYLYLGKYDVNGFTPFTTNSWLTFKPNDILRLDGGYDRETVEDITSFQDKIILDSGSISFDLKPNRFWFFSAKYKRSHYRDENNQNTVFARAEYRLWQKPYLKLFYSYYYSDWADQMNHGYFNPYSIFSNTGGVYASTHLGKRLFAETEISTGYEVQYPKQSRPTFHSSLGLNYLLTSAVSAFGRGEYFIANDTNPDKRYSKGSLWFGLTYSFGGEPSKQPNEAQQPQRPMY